MTKADIVEDIAQKTGLTKKEVAETVDLFLTRIGDLLVDGRHLEIRGFGTFKVKERKERMIYLSTLRSVCFNSLHTSSKAWHSSSCHCISDCFNSFMRVYR